MRIGWDDVRLFLRREWLELVTFRPSDRPWEMPFAAALLSEGQMRGILLSGAVVVATSLPFLL